MEIERREFIRKSCLACGSLIGIGSVLSLLSSCSPLTTMNVKPEQGVITVPRDKFTEENKMVILKNFDYLDFDIAVVEVGENQFKAFEMQCTHQPNYPLIASKDGFYCNAHGSIFGFDGQVKKAPAKKPMKEYQIEVTQQIIKINI